MDQEQLEDGRSRFTTIELDMKRYSTWVRELSEDGLVSIFELGVKVKESVTLTIDVDQAFLEEALTSQMKPIQDSVSNIETEVKRQVNTVQENVSREVKTLTEDLKENIQNALDPKIKEIGDAMTDIKEQVDKQVTRVQQEVNNSVSERVTKLHTSVVEIEQQVTTKIEEIKRRVIQDVGKEIEGMNKNVQVLKGDVSKHLTGINDSLTERVNTVAERVPPLSSLNTTITQSAENIQTQINSTLQEIKSSESRVCNEFKGMKSEVYSEIKICKEKIDEISKSLVKPGVKGVVGEMTVLKILKHRFPSWSVEDVASSGQKMGDIVATTALGDEIMIEVKNHTKPVPLNECNKFEENLTASPSFKVGILLSLKSGISNHSPARDFEVKFLQSKNQYRIYMPNAMQEPDGNRVVWSVLMAEQLAQIRMELTSGQVKGLEEICDRFKRDVEQANVCKESLKNLEKAMKKLKDDISPFFEILRKTKESLHELLHPVS